MSMGNYNANNGEDFDSGSQKQIQSNKQKVILKQDQNSSNQIMCKILSELESLAIDLGYKGEIIFGFYSTKNKDKKSIIDKIILQMTIFASSYKSFVKKNPNKKYEYPKNLKLEEIKKIIDDWKKSINKIKDKDKKVYLTYYDEFLNIISDKDLSKNFNDEFEKLDQNSKRTTNSELKRVMNAGVLGACYTSEKNNEIEEQINEKGDYEVNVMLNGKQEDNKFNKNMEKYDEHFNKLKTQLYEILDLLMGNLEIYALLKAKKKNDLNVKYANNLKNKNLEKTILSNFSKALEKYNNISNKLFQEFSFSIIGEEKEKINKIKEDLEKWKNNVNDEEKILEFDEAIKCICEEMEPMN